MRKQLYRYSLLVAFLISSSIIYLSCSKSNENTSTASLPEYSSLDVFKGIMFAQGPISDMIPEYKQIHEMTAGYMTPDVAKRMAAGITSIINTVETYNPGFLDEYKTEVLSKNPVRVDAEIKKAKDLVFKAIFLNSTISNVNNELIVQEVKNDIVQNPSKFSSLLSGINNKNASSSELYASAKEIFGNNLLHKDNELLMRKNFPNSALNQGDCFFVAAVAVIAAAVVINVAAVYNVGAVVNVAYTSTAVETTDIVKNQSSLKDEMYIKSIIKNVQVR